MATDQVPEVAILELVLYNCSPAQIVSDAHLTVLVQGTQVVVDLGEVVQGMSVVGLDEKTSPE